MEKRSVGGRWQAEVWRPAAVVPHEGHGAPERLAQDEHGERWLYPGFEIALHRDEAEGYYLNVTTEQPFVFVMWRMEDDRAVPKLVTVSYNEAGRMMDGGETVEGVPMPLEYAEWLARYVEAHYRPESKKRIRPPSFKGARRDD